MVHGIQIDPRQPAAPARRPVRLQERRGSHGGHRPRDRRLLARRRQAGRHAAFTTPITSGVPSAAPKTCGVHRGLDRFRWSTSRSRSTLRDLALPDGVTLLSDPDEVVAKVNSAAGGRGRGRGLQVPVEEAAEGEAPGGRRRVVGVGNFPIPARNGRAKEGGDGGQRRSKRAGSGDDPAPQ